MPNTPTTLGRVRVRDAGNNVIVDSSDANFTILAATPFVNVTAPNGGERYYCGQTKNITWQAPTFNISFVKIEYTMNGGTTWNVITSSTQNNGTYPWLVPSVNIPMSNCKIRISKADESYYYDVSDSAFEIRPGIVVISPNNNSSLFQSCTVSSVTWQGDASTNCAIELSTDSGTTWTMVNANFAVTSFNNSYSWNIPNYPSDKCLVRVTDLNNSTYTDMSDSVFTIKPSIVLNYPSYGGILQSGTTAAISWTSYSASNYYNLEYSLNNGQNWTTIGTNIYAPTNSYNWTVPAGATTNAKIRVTDYLASCKTAQTINPFSIASKAATVTLSSPNSGSFSSCSPVAITWTTSSTSVTNVNLLYSIDAGVSWNLIATNINASLGNYSWTAPNTASAKVLAKVVDANDQTNFDVSDNVFAITKALNVTITANKPVTLCVGDTLTLTSSSTVNNTWSNGATTQSIKVTTSGTYSTNLVQGNCTANSNIVIAVFNPTPAVPVVSTSGSTTICDGSSVTLLSSVTNGNTWLPSGQTTQGIIVTANGNYAVMNSNQFGCTATSVPVTVTVIKSSTPPLASSNSPVYNGMSVNLFASTITGATYSWLGPNGFSSNVQNPVIPSVLSNMSGVYTVSANISGCQTPVSSTTVNVLSAASVKIGGVFTTPKGDNIPNVKVSLTGGSKQDTLCDINGQYSFNGYTSGAYTVTPSKNNEVNKANGLSTLDLIKIQSHILHIDTLDAPYKIIAADVNGSGTVTSLDMIYIRRLILGIDSTFPGNKLWSFVDANYTFTNNSNPFPYPSSKSFTLQNQLDSVNFKGMKLGDVTYDWNKNLFRGAKRQEVILFADTNNVAGKDTFSVRIKADKFEKIKGLQLTFGWNAGNMKFVGIGNNPLNIEFGTQKTKDGLLAMQWNDAANKAITLNEGDDFIELRFVKQHDFDVEQLNINATITNIECFNEALELCDLKMRGGLILNKKSIPATDVIATIQVYPNPTQGEVTVAMEGFAEGKYAYKITNLAGQIITTGILVKEGSNNHFKINLPLLGVYRKGYYFLTFIVKNKVVTHRILFN